MTIYKKAIVASALAVTIVGAILFAVFAGDKVPDPITMVVVSILLGIAAATLIYNFLGGTEGASFRTKGIKLGGSAAVLAAMFIMSHWLLERDVANARQAEVEQQHAKDDKAIDDLQNENKELKKQLAQPTGNDTQRALQLIKVSLPNSAFGRDILDLRDRGVGVFNEFEGDSTPVRITVAPLQDDERRRGRTLFNYCDELHFPNRRVRFSIDRAEGDSNSKPVDAFPGGPIGAGQCQGVDRNRIQLSCDSMHALMPSRVISCDANGNWVTKDVLGGEKAVRFKGYAQVFTSDQPAHP